MADRAASVVAALFGLDDVLRCASAASISPSSPRRCCWPSFILVINQQPYTGGFVGIKNLADLELFGSPSTYNRGPARFLDDSPACCSTCFLACTLLVRSKFGKVLTAIRDNENRVLALGYNTAVYKIFVFALAGALAGLAGALYTAANGLAGPDLPRRHFSIEIVILVAVGGRGTLFGAVLGAVPGQRGTRLPQPK